MSQIQTLLVDQIDPHPNNPRRDLGDLTELAASIQALGILQPLVVVPNEDRYRVVIGHRRLAAARMAGLVEVPTHVETSLTDSEQVQLMLVENVQRDDLTPVEEAAGYQQLLDLGMKVTMIAKRTGRPRKTVDARLQLLGLPDVAQEKVHARQLSLEEAAVLVEFDGDVDAVEGLLKYAGTPNWGWAVKQQRDRLEREKAMKPIVDKLQAFGLEQVDADDARARYSMTKIIESVDEIEDEYPAGCVFVPSSWQAAVQLWVPRPETNLQADAEEQAALLAEAEEAAQQAEALRVEAAQALALRDEFVLGVLDRKLTAHERTAIVATAAAAFLDEDLADAWRFNRWFDAQLDEPDHELTTAEAWRARFPKATPDHVLLAMVHAGSRSLHNWDRAHTYTDIVAVYRLFERLGYEISDVERARVFPEDAA
ncbi:MAG: ParB/RepB/Spo0J family partition protein [Propionibacteriaceae bacterium]|nr:ParB/RepB/Spo0J family partition protein [Propionibacteriaceae bacterium]